MNVGLKLGLFALAIAAVFGAAAAMGNAIAPVVTSQPAAMDHGTDAEPMDNTPGGLQIAENGYRLVLDQASRGLGADAELSFRILAPSGKPLTTYATLHDKLLHLIVVNRDLTGFQHVHPTLGSDGTWTTRVALAAGQWRVFADFDPAGDDPQLTLGSDLAVAGAFAPQPLPAPARTAEVDGYTVTLDGDLAAGESSKLTLSVAKAGVPVTDLEPYLAAYGHLVALRVGDLAYLHVHPDGEPGDGTTRPGPAITFFAEVPSVGSYRLFLDFKHDGVVRTAEFTIATDGAAPLMAESTEPSHDH